MKNYRKKALKQWIRQNRREYQKHIANSEVLKKNSVEMVKVLTDNNVLSDGIRIFEIGCGSGRNLSYIIMEDYDIEYFGNDLIKEECFKYMDLKLKEKINFIERETLELFKDTYKVDLLISSAHLMHLPPSSAVEVLNEINNSWKPKYILLIETTVAMDGRKRKWVHDYSVLNNNYRCIHRHISEQNEHYPVILLEKN